LGLEEMTEKMPIEERQCVDCCWCLIFLMTVVIMVGIAGYGVFYGNPFLLSTAWDGD